MTDKSTDLSSSVPSNGKYITGPDLSQEFNDRPTQKPIALYSWLLKNYAKPGDRILDTHLGSGSSQIAAWNAGFDFYGCELDKDYFTSSVERFEIHKAKYSPAAQEPINKTGQFKLF